MARTNVAITQFNRDGVALPAGVVGDTVNGHVVANDGRVGLIIKNSGVASHTITFNLFTTVDGQGVVPRTEVVAAGATQCFGPFPHADYSASLSFDVNHAELLVSAVHI